MLRILTDKSDNASGKSTFSDFLERNKSKNKLICEVTITTKPDVDVDEFENKMEMLSLVRIYDMVLVKEKAGQVHYHGLVSYPKLTLIEGVNNVAIEGNLMHDFLQSIVMLVHVPKDRLTDVKKKYARKSNMKNTKIPRWGTISKWIDYCCKGLQPNDEHI